MEGKVKIIVFCIFFCLFLICDNSQNLFKANQIHIKCYKPVLLKCFAVCLRNCLVVTNFIFLLALQDVLEVQCGIIQHNENLLWNSFLMLFNNLNEQPNVSVIIILKLKSQVCLNWQYSVHLAGFHLQVLSIGSKLTNT